MDMENEARSDLVSRIRNVQRVPLSELVDVRVDRDAKPRVDRSETTFNSSI